MEAIKVLADNDLDGLISQADVEGWSQLVLVGPTSYATLVGHLPEQFRASDNIFRLASFELGLAHRLASLTNLTHLDLSRNSIGDYET